MDIRENIFKGLSTVFGTYIPIGIYKVPIMYPVLSLRSLHQSENVNAHEVTGISTAITL